MKFLKIIVCLSAVLATPVRAEEITVVQSSCEVRFLNYVDNATIEALLTKIEDTTMCAEGDRVHLTLQTGGGDVDAGMFAYKMLRKRGIDTHVEYSAASMGLILLLAGDERTMASDASLLIHQITRYVGGEPEKDKLREYVEGIDILHEDYVAVVVERTGLTKEKVESLMADHMYLNANEALEFGFVTSIIK